jgi:hypothetical protein
MLGIYNIEYDTMKFNTTAIREKTLSTYYIYIYIYMNEARLTRGAELCGIA